MPKNAKNWIVETEWLAEHLDAPDLVIFDASWYLPSDKRDVKAESLIALGCAEFIDKPIDRPFLKERIRKIELQRVSKMIREKQSESDSKEKRESCTGGGEARSIVDNDLVTTQLKAQLLCLDEHAATTASHLQEVREAINQILGRVAAANQELVGAATGN